MNLLRVGTLPFLTRRNYYYEFKHLLFWSVLAGLVEGQFASVAVSRVFNGSELLIAIASATPVAAHVFSLPWGMLCVGRPKISVATFFATGTALCAGTVAAVPHSRSGAVWFVCQMAAAQVLLTGVLTVRSAFWKSNYPGPVRGQIVARLQGLRFVVGVASVMAASAVCDRAPWAFRVIFPCAAVAGVMGITLLSRLHVRGERRELRGPAGAPGTGDGTPAAVEPFAITALLSPGNVFEQMYRVLRDDRRFAHYCAAQLLSGLANLMTISIVVAVVTRDLPAFDTERLWISTGLIVALPRLVMLASLPRWGRLFDRLGVIRFRVVNVACWTGTLALGLIAVMVTMERAGDDPAYLMGAVVLFSIRAVLYGLSVGGAALAWNLGHLHFARPEQAEVYMGIHVSLTGIRGLVAPLAGMWLWHRIGYAVWFIAITMSLGSLLAYSSLARAERNERWRAPGARDKT